MTPNPPSLKNLGQKASFEDSVKAILSQREEVESAKLRKEEEDNKLKAHIAAEGPLRADNFFKRVKSAIEARLSTPEASRLFELNSLPQHPFSLFVVVDNKWSLGFSGNNMDLSLTLNSFERGRANPITMLLMAFRLSYDENGFYWQRSEKAGIDQTTPGQFTIRSLDRINSEDEFVEDFLATLIELAK
ncbi:hypothetical protein GCM10023185_07020 [Hymenobacter saemangeumensis]|uniref:YokE-like PH domain-containing protein n=1 Tax=Hymenobacter saemangeumensis TaxID=1084522 RepID=A0ABP8I2I1_9BACT